MTFLKHNHVSLRQLSYKTLAFLVSLLLVFVLAAPVAIGAGTCVAVVSRIKNKQLLQEKERIYVIALEKSNSHRTHGHNPIFFLGYQC